METVWNAWPTILNANYVAENYRRSCLPLVIAVVAVIAVVLVMVLIMPVFVEMFTDAGVELPVATKILIAVSNFLGLTGTCCCFLW